LASGADASEKPSGIGVQFAISCPFGADEVLTKAKDILKIVGDAAIAGWPFNKNIIVKLPDWFTAACSPEMSPEDAQRWLTWWRSLSPREQRKAELEKGWSLENWLYWMEPDNRQWFWWDAKIIDNDIALAIEVEGWPFPWGSLRWLFLASGASAIETESA